jgi:DNA-binding HxlR family transcriptional regulator
MERTSYEVKFCSIARTLSVLGEKWTLLIVRESFYGATRFEQFLRVLECPRNLLSERLALLVEEGIFEQSEYREPGSRTRKEYRLTEKGRALMPILLAIREWGDRYKTPAKGPAVLANHANCGSELHVTLTCGAGHIVTRAEDVELVPGPGVLSATRLRR